MIFTPTPQYSLLLILENIQEWSANFCYTGSLKGYLFCFMEPFQN